MQPERIVRKRDLPEYCGLRRSQIAHLIKRGDFPRPIKLGERSVGWLASELSAWQERRRRERDGS